MREGEQQADSISITSRPPVRLSITPEPDLLTEPIEVITEGPTETEQSPFAGPTKPTSELDKTESIRRQFIRTKPLTRFETYRDVN